jgi:tetratricopeptide (TPR) repeat protein
MVLLSEVYDYYGQFRASGSVSRLGKTILSAPPRRRLLRNELAQAKVRLAVAYARSLYRRNKYDEAEKLLMDCRDYVTSYIRNDSFPNFGTLGEIAYTLGRLHLQRQRFLSALGEFNTAIESYNEGILRKRKDKAPKPRSRGGVLDTQGCDDRGLGSLMVQLRSWVTGNRLVWQPHSFTDAIAKFW